MSQITQTYTTAEVCAIAGVSAPRIHQMRNGQKVKTKNNRIYDIKPSLVEGTHWKWHDSDVVFTAEGLKAILERRTKRPSVPKDAKPPKPAKQSKTVLTSNGVSIEPKRRGRPRKVVVEQPLEVQAPQEAQQEPAMA